MQTRTLHKVVALMTLSSSWGSRNRSYAHLCLNSSSVDSNAKTVAIVGGGMAGISAAQELLNQHLPVKITMFDAGKVPGGRMCSKRIYNESTTIDHGCQFICPRSSVFLSAVRQWERTGKVRKCEDLRIATSGESINTADGYFRITDTPMPRDSSYIGIPHMGALAFSLLSDLKTIDFQLESGTVVDHMRWDQKERTWSLYEKKREDYNLLGTYDAVILAEGASMFRYNSTAISSLPEPVHVMISKVISSVRYIPAFIFIAFFEKSLYDRLSVDAINIEPPASINYSSSGKSEQTSGLSAFRFICNATAKLHEQDKSRNKQEMWIAITSPSKSSHILSEWPMRDDQGNLIPQDERYRSEIANHLLEDFSVAMEHIANQYSDEPLEIRIKHQQVQRWGSAFPENKLQFPCLASSDYSMVICGDCFTGVSPKMNISLSLNC
eukprot:jgi/Picsp_1/1464/NSC_04943-R1_fad nad -binding oxidoreductase domain-containing protein